MSALQDLPLPLMTFNSHRSILPMTAPSCRFAAFGRGLAGIVAVQALLSVPAVSQAAIYKCVTVAGDTTYTSAPCARDESTRRISNNAAAVAGLDCRIARKLAFDTTRRMKQGEPSDSLFDSHGGLNSLSPLVIGLVSYIYTFEGNEDVSANRIATLATERCQVGSFGANVRRCEVYPYGFLEQLGGCQAARDEGDSTAVNAVSDATAPDSASQDAVASTGSAGEPSLGAALPAEPARYPVPSVTPHDDTEARDAAIRMVNERAACKLRISETLEDTGRQMQAGVSVVEQERLRTLQRQLRMQIARC